MAVLKDVVLPTLAKGPLIRRRKVVGFAERAHIDDNAVLRMQALRRKYGPGPLLLKIPFRPQAVLLSREDVTAVLEASPEPFKAASLEKKAALGHFEPSVVLASHGPERRIRRELNEQTLETGCEMHSLAGQLSAVIAEEMDAIAGRALSQGVLDWDTFFTGWFRMVRRIVLGDPARDDVALTDRLQDLRYRANYAFLRPKDRSMRKEVLQRLYAYVERAEPGSLAARMASACAQPDQKPHHQLPQYLFAFDPGAMASFRTLALLSVHPDDAARVRGELGETAKQAAPRLPFLKACYLEALRLWPTTPAILRETTERVEWREGHLDASTHVIIFAPFFHRDDETLADAHTFNPGLWTESISRPDLALVPFSHGPVVCPAAHFVPMVATLALRRLLTQMNLSLDRSDRLPAHRLPGTLDNYTLSFSAAAAPALSAAP
ncbi:MAG TPA: cytochrome P450 [Devosia sp.]|jgi:cytochrome P450|nr:cytochrome P450 [Devosia sp.]